MILILNHAEIDALLLSDSGPVGAEITKLAFEVETEAKRLCPVDTGRLRSSIYHILGHDSNGVVGFVGSDVNYAIYQELGTRYQSGTPYLRPALQSVRP